MRKVIRRQVESSLDGIDVAGGINAVVAANVNEPGSSQTSVSSTQRIVQRSGRRQTSSEGSAHEQTREEQR